MSNYYNVPGVMESQLQPMAQYQPYPAQYYARGMMNTPADSFTRMTGGQPQSRFSFLNAAFNFIKGGVIDTVSGLFSTGGICTMAAAGAAIWLTGGAAIPYLAAASIGLGGLQFAKGSINAMGHLAQGNGEAAERDFQDIGSGVTATLMGLFGARSAYKTGLVKTGTMEGKKLISAEKAVSQDFIASMKATFKQLVSDLRGQSRVLTQNGKKLSKNTLFQTGKKSTVKNYGGAQQKLSDIWYAKKPARPNVNLRTRQQPSFFDRGREFLKAKIHTGELPISVSDAKEMSPNSEYIEDAI